MAPPYPSIPFGFPDYSHDYPFGQSAYQQLDPNTGELTIVPNENGNYIVGIKINEYRNGQLIGTVFRDLMYKVIDCGQKVDATLAADSIDTDGRFIYTICNGHTVQTVNTSTQQQHIDDYFWQLDDGNAPYTDTAWHPVLNFSAAGIYDGRLVLNPDGACSDTADVRFVVSTAFDADFELAYDTCVGGPVDFTNRSASSVPLAETLWDFGPGNSTETNPSFGYETPGAKSVLLTIKDGHGCRDSVRKAFDWQPAPPVLLVSPSAEAGCLPLSVHFENQSSPLDSTYRVHWEFGDGNTDTAINPEHTFTTAGHYSAYLSVTSPIGCFIDTVFEHLVLAENAPDADFTWLPTTVSSAAPEARFIPAPSDNTLFYNWYFGDDRFPSMAPSPAHHFADTGRHAVTLVVEDRYGCQDSVTHLVDVAPFASYFMPNAFTPNQDGLNDTFKGVGLADAIMDFRLQVFNRWGQLVFESADPAHGWNGRLHNTGKDLPNGVYPYRLRYRMPRKPLTTQSGEVVLVR